jgi:hypothetical protein
MVAGGERYDALPTPNSLALPSSIIGLMHYPCATQVLHATFFPASVWQDLIEE